MPESGVFPGFFEGLDLKPDFWKSSVFLYGNISTAKCMSGCNLGLDVTIWGSGLDVKRGYTNRNVEDWIVWNELGISGGTAIVILIALYFVIKWAVKNGIKEAYSAITGKKTVEDIQNEKELKELGLDSEDQ